MVKTIISNLQVEESNGQLFITWSENKTPVGTTFKVYQSRELITSVNLADAVLLAHHIEPYSARDWWQDPGSFSYKEKHSTPVGFSIFNNKPLSINKGLFVHTITSNDNNIPKYYAVTALFPEEKEQLLIMGENSLISPIIGVKALPQPIFLGEPKEYIKTIGKDKSLVLNLHWRGGGMTAGPSSEFHPVNYLFFGDKKMGWREGLAFKFNLRITNDVVWIEPNDRAWTGGRAVTESKDLAKRDYCPAVNTWWYGYNSNIHTTTLNKNPEICNYTEEYLLYLVQWAQEFLGTNQYKTYIVGASMGGSGALSMSMHYPKIFAATVAHVGVVSYVKPGEGTATRLENICGPLNEKSQSPSKIPLLKYMNGEYMASNITDDIPYIYMTNGRNDKSFSWRNKPAFYKAMLKAKQGLTVYWNNGDHDMHKNAPADFYPNNLEGWANYLQKFALNQSFPVFTNCSESFNPGNGQKEDGDLEGWINRGMFWENIKDKKNSYTISIKIDYLGIKYPVTVDMTPRRCQNFKPQSGTKLIVFVENQKIGVSTVNKNALFTIKNVLFPKINV